LLRTLEPLVVSRALDQLQWLGIQIAEAVDDRAAGARLEANLHQTAAMQALRSGEKKEAASHFSQAAALSLRGDKIEEAIRTTHASTALLLRLGEHDLALRAAEEMLMSVEQVGFENATVRLALYGFAGVTRRAPATEKWAALLARMRRGT